jgi:trk system potassium uptake protein TrkH
MRARNREDREFRRARRPFLRHPGQVVVVAFAIAIAIGTATLMLPPAREGDGGASFLDALFTSTSAVCVTGLSTVDVPNYWTPFGQVVILVLIQVGGFGIMTMATLLGLLISRRLGLRSRLTTTAEARTVGIADVREVIIGIVKVTVVIEAVTAVVLAFRFALAYDESPGRAAYLGLFHAVSAFNNAGFALWSDSLMGFAADPWVCLPISAAVILGGIGFPVLFELRKEFRQTQLWSIHLRITLGGTILLLAAGMVFITANEWTNPATLGALDPPGRLLAGFTQSVMPRTAGFNSLDFAEMKETSLLATTVLMFIGGGSGGTAGGIKVTTFFLLLYVILAEVRGEPDVEAGKRRIDPRGQRQALTVALLSVAAVVGSSLVLMELTDLSLAVATFEVTSAFATVGLSTGVTASLPVAAKVLLIGLMFLGRLGPITLVSALALRERQHRYRLPEGRPLIG